MLFWRLSQTQLAKFNLLVGLSRLERLTSPLSAGCSNHLSYRPRTRKRNASATLLDSVFFTPIDKTVNHFIGIYLPRKEVIQPQVLLRLPCYDFTPITPHTLGIRLFYKLAKITSGTNSFRGVTGGVYKVRERIHRVVLIRDY